MRYGMALGLLGIAGLVLPEAVRSDSPAGGPQPAGSVMFVMHRVGNFRSEACGVGDFNRDGKLDIVAGPFLYLAPDWKAVKIRTLKGDVDDQGKGYYWDFVNAPLDVDGDGWLDVVSCSWHEMCSRWFRNPGPAGGEWQETLIEKNGNFEAGDLWDVDNDGKRQELVPAVPGVVWYEVGTGPDGKRGILKHVVTTKQYDWGVGAGDVNGDGRTDLLRPGAWFEAPADPRQGEWIEHPLAVGNKEEGRSEHTPQIWVYDVNADGLNDIVTSSAHRYGIFWYEQVRKGSEIAWKQHLIDDSWTQAHSITLADLDGDGDLDLVTGKRFMAHNGHDPEEYAPLGVYWYELVRGASPRWVKHVISYNQGVGSGMNIPVEDIDGDGDLDIVVTGKWGGPVWFENRRGSPSMSITKEQYGTMPDGTVVDRYTLANGGGVKASIITYGATLISVETPDRNGKVANITLDLESLEAYLAGHPFFGSIAGRYANRIAKGRFTLDGVEYQLATNNGPNHLHGGRKGFDKAVWKAEPIEGAEEVGVKLTHVSPDGDEGYPGTLTATVVYTLTPDNALKIEYTATTDKPTHVNLTNHAYWNLGGAAAGNVLGHVLTIHADRYLPVDEGLIPLGELAPVRPTPMDFTTPMPIGSRIDQVPGGYDHCYVLNKKQPGELSLAARVVEPKCGRTMEIYTTQPGIQFYTGNFLDGSLKARGVVYGKHHGFCLETQHFPDSPNRPDFPSTVLRPGQTYHEVTIHKFGVL